MDVLKYFGKAIQRLSVGNRDAMDDERVAAIHKQVNEYCSETLSSLDLRSIKNVMFEQFDRPFSNLIAFDFSINTDEMGSLESLNEMFPKLQKLNIAYITVGPAQLNASRFIESDVPHMPHLVELKIRHETLDHLDIPIIKNQFQQIMEKNPQITRLDYTHQQRSGFIKVISESLPNLDYLFTWNIAFDIEPVQFDSVKIWKTITHKEPVEKLSFPRLESLEMMYSRDENMHDSWLTFFRNHQNIKQLNCSIHGEGFHVYVAQLPNVEEINIIGFTSFEADEITPIVESSRNLVRLQYKTIPIPLFQSLGPNDEEMATYNEKFGSEWNISYDPQDWHTLLFEKKN